MQLVECIPNFSEGRRRDVIDAISDAIASTDGVDLFDVDPGAATNRTVVTFVGPPGPVEEAAFRAVRTAAGLIDMATHTGEHPRMGATDVCPFVPVAGVTMDACVAMARRVGERIGAELGIPVYLYGEAATAPERASLADVRRGGYEGLPHRSDRPDFGPASFNARSGATAVGARPFLIAYNVDLNTRDRKAATAIAQAIRTLGKPRRDPAGAIMKDGEGNTLYDPGRFQEVRAVGWYIEEYGRAQVSINLTNFEVTGLHDVFDACREEAVRTGLRVTGSEIVGLVPRAALLTAGDHYLAKQARTRGVPETERIHSAIISLGLNDVAPFDPALKVIEYRASGPPTGLVVHTVAGFVDEVSTDSPAPGGGSVAALCGALAAALASMVASLSFSKPGMEEARPMMEASGRAAQDLKEWFLAAVDRDAAAFDAVFEARRLPKGTEQEQATREAAIEVANERAARVPLEVVDHAVAALAMAGRLAREGNPNLVSDAGVAVACGLAAAEGAALNVRINLSSISNAAVRDSLRQDLEASLGEARRLAGAARRDLDAVLGHGG